MQRRRRFDLTPKVNATEFGAEWRTWWTSIQPAWREADDWPLSHVASSGADWGVLEHAGTNGLFLILMALSWWGTEIPSQCDKRRADFVLAIHDVQWVLMELVKNMGTSKKRDADNGSMEQPATKR
jgi:hypothetical protein